MNVIPIDVSRGLQTGAEDGRTAPVNLDAEQSLLGAILVNNEAYLKVASFLRPEHFSEPVHQRIYAEVETLIQAGRVADPTTLRSYLNDQDLGGLTAGEYVARLAASATTIILAGDYGRHVHDAYLGRQLREIGAEVMSCAFEHSSALPPAAQIEKVQEQLAALQVTVLDRERRNVSLAGANQEMMADVEAALKGEDTPFPVTGIDLLDAEISLAPSTLVGLFARTSMGKSIIGLEWAYAVASQGYGVVLHSLEMSRKQIAARMNSSHLERQSKLIPFERILKPKLLTPEEAEIVAHAAREVEGLPIRIEDAGGRTIVDIANASEQAANAFAKRGIRLGLVVIDHAHIVRFTLNYRDDVKALKEVTQGSLDLCKRLDTCVLLLGQINRGPEARGDEDRRPRLSDVRGAGSFEEDCDVVIFPYRHAYYIERSPAFRRGPGADAAAQAAQDEYAETKHQLEFIIEKNRAGRAGQTVKAWISPAQNAIRNADDRRW